MHWVWDIPLKINWSVRSQNLRLELLIFQDSGEDHEITINNFKFGLRMSFGWVRLKWLKFDSVKSLVYWKLAGSLGRVPLENHSHICMNICKLLAGNVEILIQLFFFLRWNLKCISRSMLVSFSLILYACPICLHQTDSKKTKAEEKKRNQIVLRNFTRPQRSCNS